MSTQLQIRRDTHANLQLATPVVGEIGYDTSFGRLVAGNGSRAGGIPHANLDDIIRNKYISGTVGGSSNAITLTLNESPGIYTTYQTFLFRPLSNNTGAVTLNVNGVGTKAIKKYQNGVKVDLVADDLITQKPTRVTADTVDFILDSSEQNSKPPTVQVFTSSGTYYKPAGLVGTKVTVTGGGAGFRNSTTTWYAGGTSSFGSHCSATGGNLPGTNATSSGGKIHLKGSYGSEGKVGDSPGQNAIHGADSYGSGCPARTSTGSTRTGASGSTVIDYIPETLLSAAETITIGAGGTLAVGGVVSGRAGVVIVEEYY